MLDSLLTTHFGPWCVVVKKQRPETLTSHIGNFGQNGIGKWRESEVISAVHGHAGTGTAVHWMQRDHYAAGVMRSRSKAPKELKRTLGLFPVTLVGVGITVGAGIYVLVGVSARSAGRGVWLSFLLAGVLSALSALSYAELASMYPRANAEHEFARHALPDWIAFLTGWMMVTALMVAASAVAWGFAGYLQIFIDVPEHLAAVALLFAATMIGLSGIERSTRLTTVFALIQIAGLIFVIAFGAGHIGQQSLGEIQSFGGVLTGAALVFFAFIGFDEVTSLSEETKNPSRVIPAALLLSLAISTVLYVLVALVAISVLGPERLGSSSQPLAAVVDHVLNTDAGGRFVGFAALVSTFNTTLLCLTSASRLLYGMANAGAVPTWFKEITGSHQVPRRGFAVSLGVAIGFTFLKSVGSIASVTDISVFLIFIVVNITLLILRKTKPEAERPFRVPVAIRGVPIFPILALGSVALLLPRFSLEPWLYSAALAAAGMAIRTVMLQRRTRLSGD